MSDIFVPDDLSLVTTQAVTLRTEFDRSFSEPTHHDLRATEDLLAVRIENDVFAIRLFDITGLYVGKKVTRVPSGDPTLVGIASFRGTILPVYGLATLLGRPAEASPRWLVIAAMAPVALAFTAFEHHLRVASATIRLRDPSTKDQLYAREFVPIQHFVRPILHLPSIVDAIRTRRPAIASGEDQ